MLNFIRINCDLCAIPKNRPVLPIPRKQGPTITHRSQNTFANDSVKGDAAKFIVFVNAKGSCGSGLKGIGITNKSEKVIEAKLELTTSYNGHVSKKTINIEALSPNEVNFVGCTGCTDNTLFKTCTIYRVVSANFK